MGRHIGLIKKDAAKMIAVWKDLILVWKVRAATINEIDARQIISTCNLLGAKVLLYREGKIRAAFHRRIIGNDHTVNTANLADARDHASRRHLVIIHAIGCKLANL